tara:strand:+ start:2532 stop:3014 length:483 start_codon:yes stop_codon:yes gene_type:complete
MSRQLSLQEILKSMKKIPKKPEYTKLQTFLNEQEKKGIEKKKKRFDKLMGQYEKAQKINNNHNEKLIKQYEKAQKINKPNSPSSVKKDCGYKKMELSKYEKYLLKKMQVKSKKYISPKNTQCSPKSTHSSPKSTHSSPKSTQSSPKSTQSSPKKKAFNCN